MDTHPHPLCSLAFSPTPPLGVHLCHAVHTKELLQRHLHINSVHTWEN